MLQQFIRLIAILAAGWLAQNAYPQQPAVAEARLGVDVLRLADGPQIYGFVLDRPADGSVRFAVERKWLESTYPKLFEQLSADEREETTQARAELLQRIEDWLVERPGDNPTDQPLHRYLEMQLQAAQAIDVDNPSDKTFFSTEFARKQIGKLTVQAPERRHIAGIAYQYQIADIVTTPTTQLASRLDEIGVKPETEQVDLTDELPGLVRQSPRQWAARQALVEFAMRDAVEYQGTGQTFVRSGQPVDAGGLIGELLGGGMLGGGLLGGGGSDPISQLGAELGLPEFSQPKSSTQWWKKMTQTAEREGHRGVLITRLTQSLLSPVVQVEMIFFAKQSAGEWFPVTKLQAQSNANDQTAERLAQLRLDPQIQSAIGLLESLGLAANTQLDQALRHGAATQEGLANARSQWNLFLQRHTQSLSDRPLTLQKISSL